MCQPTRPRSHPERFEGAGLQYHRLQRIKDRWPPLPNRFWREIGGFSQARIAFFQKLKCELRKRHFWKKKSKKIERRAPLRRRVIFFKKITVIIVLSTEKLKSILFEDHDRMSKMPWLCHPNSHPVQVFCTLYCRSSDFKDALPVPS